MGTTHQELMNFSMWEEKQHMIFIIDKHTAIYFRDGESRLHIQANVSSSCQGFGIHSSLSLVSCYIL